MSDGLKKRFDSEVEKVASDLRAENARKFKRATDYIESEERETQQLLTKINKAVSGEISLTEALNGNIEKPNTATLISTQDTSKYSTESELPDFTEFDESARQAYGKMLAAALPLDKSSESMPSSEARDGSSREIIAIRDESVASSAQLLLDRTKTLTAQTTSHEIELAANESGLYDTGENLAEYQYR